MKELITYPLNDVDYSAEDAGLFHCTRKSGVWYEDSFPIEVSGEDNTIFIGKGLAWFSNTEFWGKVAAQKTKVSLDLEYADPVYDRIDVIALQFDANKNATNLIVKKGKAKTKPTIPSISRTEAVYELYLYAITRPAASLTVTSENVRDLRLDDAYCGLMADSVTSLDFPVVPVEKGGTGAETIVEARKSMNYIGSNPIEKVSSDTPDTWSTLGIGYAVFSKNLLNGQPHQYGFLENIVDGASVVQKFVKTSGGIWYRTGNSNKGWYDGGKWIKEFDEKETIPIANGGTGATSVAGARESLGLGAASTKDIVPIANGGTGANTASAARANLGIKLSESSTPVTSTNIESVSDNTVYGTVEVVNEASSFLTIGDVKVVLFNRFLKLTITKELPADTLVKIGSIGAVSSPPTTTSITATNPRTGNRYAAAYINSDGDIKLKVSVAIAAGLIVNIALTGTYTH